MLHFVVPSAFGGSSLQPCFGATKFALLWPLRCHDGLFKGHPIATTASFARPHPSPGLVRDQERPVNGAFALSGESWALYSSQVFELPSGLKTPLGSVRGMRWNSGSRPNGGAPVKT